MAYPGNTELSAQAQERVMAAFRQVVSKLQEGQREEALIGLEFVLRLDPTFSPALNLQQQLASGSAEIDLSEVISQLQAPTTETINSLLVEAVEDFNNRDLSAAKEKVEKVLLDLPGHQEARQLLSQVQEAVKVEAQVGQFLAQAQEALSRGDSQEAANFVMMAQALDPHHQGIAETLAAVDRSGDSSSFSAEANQGSEGAEFSFDTIDDAAPMFSETSDDGDLFGGGGFDEVSAASESTPAPSSSPDFSVDEPVSEEQSIYSDTAGDVSDLFEADPMEVTQAQPTITTDAGSTEGALQELLTRGDSAASAENFAAAIDAWSRVFLLDPSHQEAAHRIELAQLQKEEIDKRLDQIVADAQDAYRSGDLEKASTLVNEILSQSPNHVEATRLKENLETGQAPAAGSAARSMSEMPDLEEDLFQEDTFETSDLDSSEDLTESETTTSLPEAQPTPSPRRSLWVMVAIVACGLIVVLLGVWAGSKMFSSEEVGDQATAVNEILREAQTLFDQNKVEEAVHLLEEFPAQDIYQTRIDRRLEKYYGALAPPTPTPVPENLTKAKEMMVRGQWMDAYSEVMVGLDRYPRDGGLNDLREDILAIEPRASSFFNTYSSGNYPGAVSIARDLLDDYPGLQDLEVLYENSLFNAALAELRAYNLTGADTFLKELAERRPDDEEVQRVLVFVESYKTRPVDLKLKVFIRNIPQR